MRSRLKKQSVLIVDSDTDLRNTIVEYLSMQSDICVAGSVGDGIEALTAVRQCRPDVIVIDSMLPLLLPEPQQRKRTRLYFSCVRRTGRAFTGNDQSGRKLLYGKTGRPCGIDLPDPACGKGYVFQRTVSETCGAHIARDEDENSRRRL